MCFKFEITISKTSRPDQTQTACYRSVKLHLPPPQQLQILPHMSKQQSLSSSSRKCSTEPTLITSDDKIKKKKKLHNQQKNPRSRSPLQDYLNIPISSIRRSNSNSSNLSSSSAISIEAPSGCLNFFSKTPLNVRPGNRPKPKFLSKNPKSSPNPLQFKENRVTHKSKGSKSGKLSSSTKAASKAKISTDFDNHHSGELLDFPGFANNCNSDNLVAVKDCTPVGKLVSSGSVLKSAIGKDDCKSNGERSNTSGTPPVQSSLSPEIQCGSSVLVSGAAPSTATCYGAGHVVSGVIDRRKCRPRGTLIVGASQSSECSEPLKDVFDGINDENCVGVVRKSRPSFIPLPAEASMSWKLSPSQEEEEGGSMNGVPSLPCRFDSNMFRYANYSGTSNSNVESGRKTRITLLSPCITPVLKQEERTFSRFNLISETSRFSLGSLGSGNVIQTPTSGSSKEKQIGRSCLNELDDQKDSSEEYELESVSELLQQASLSPWSRTPPSYPSSKLANLTSPNNPIGFNQVQKKCDIRVSCFSNRTFEDVSPSQMRISWRDGLVSRIFEMDDLDSCRLLSDEENEVYGHDNELLKSNPPTKIFTFEVQNGGLRSPEFLEHKVEVVDRKGKELTSPTNSCAESIFTDGGGLVASGDADWTLCYKNHLFEV